MDSKNVKYGNVTIGTDPTFLEKVEVLEEIPKNNSSELENNTEKINPNAETLDGIDNLDFDVAKVSNNESLTNKKSNSLLIIIISAILMIAVGGGVFFYLRLGTKNANNQNMEIIPDKNETNETINPDNDVELKNINILKNEELSTTISDYATFNVSSALSCNIDMSEVDNSKFGKYTYYVVCDNKKYSGEINVIDDELLMYSNDIIYTNVTDKVDVESFAVSSVSSFEYEEKLKKEAGGSYLIKIKQTTKNKSSNTISGLYYVYNEKPSIILNCEFEYGDYILINRFIFNDNNDDLKTPIRMYKFFIDEDYYFKYVKDIDEDGNLQLGEYYGYAIIDNYKKSISIVNELDYDQLKNEYNGEFPSTYGDIKNYYELNGYTCE